jgi:SAM-dependent methyltransferase
MHAKKQPAQRPIRLDPLAYDVFSNEEARLRREGDLLRTLAETSRARDLGVLDMACGTGIHARFFADLGCPVCARDLSKDMIDRARRIRPRPEIRWEVHDMCRPSERRFGLVLNLGNSLSALSERRDLQATFRAVSSQLAPGGRFLIQILDSESLRRDGHRLTLKKGEAEGIPIVVIKALAWVGQQVIASFTMLKRIPSDADGGADLDSVPGRSRDHGGNGPLGLDNTPNVSHPTDLDSAPGGGSGGSGGSGGFRGSDDPEEAAIWKASARVSTLKPWSPKDLQEAAAAAGLLVEKELSTYSGEPFALGRAVDYIAVYTLRA